MKMKILTGLALALLAGAFTSLAQPEPNGPGGPGHPDAPFGRRGHRPAPPLLIALDTNTNGVLEASEIANASAALMTLDKNGDGKLTPDELMPQFHGGTNQVRFNPPPGGKRPVPPLLAALDTNGDGQLDADEIANASASLLKLDTNGDGKLTPDELRPKRPEGAEPGGPGRPSHRPGGPEGPGGRSGPEN